MDTPPTGSHPLTANSARIFPRTLMAFGATLLIFAAQSGFAAEPGIRPIDPDESSRTASAVVVDGMMALAHTTQLLPLDRQGEVIEPGRAEKQAEVLLDRLELALREAKTGLDRLAKINVYAARRDAIAPFQASLSRRLGDRSRPAMSVVEGALAQPDALLAVDAVAATSFETPGGSTRLLSAAGLKGQPNAAHVAILPAGPRVYVSGQAELIPDLARATRGTLESLEATLKHLGLNKSHVVQLKAFMRPMTSVADVRRALALFFGDGAVPPVAFVEWRSSQPPIEIELIAAGGPARGGKAIAYLTPPALKASPVFSRVARVEGGDLIYVSNLYGPSGASGREQCESIFTHLEKLLGKAGGDLRHLVKATYYVTDDDASRALNDLRPRYYDPARPPAASKAIVAGVGSAGRTLTLDMIAVPESSREKPASGR